MLSIKHCDCCTAGFKAVCFKSLSKFQYFHKNPHPIFLLFVLILFVSVLTLILDHHHLIHPEHQYHHLHHDHQSPKATPVPYQWVYKPAPTKAAKAYMDFTTAGQLSYFNQGNWGATILTSSNIIISKENAQIKRVLNFRGGSHQASLIIKIKNYIKIVW